jgi:Fe/S biogenesis protein NfuA
VNDIVEPVLTITDAARDKILEIRAGSEGQENDAIWVAISGEANGAFTYDITLRSADDAGEVDLVQDHDGLPAVVDADSVVLLTGATLDFGPAGFVMDNPNRPAAKVLDLPVGDLSSPLAQEVLRVLEEMVNPQIAAHGGTAELVAVDGSIAFLRLGGGCQGCASAKATLKQGIEVMILDHVEGITEVVDVTDHTSGANPYYAHSH